MIRATSASVIILEAFEKLLIQVNVELFTEVELVQNDAGHCSIRVHIDEPVFHKGGKVCLVFAAKIQY